MARPDETPFGLSEAQVVRYARHLILPEVGGAGQRRLLDAAARVDGAGPAHEEAALFLAAAGVGRLFIDAPDVAARVLALNPDVRVEAPGDVPDCPWRCEARGERRLDGALAALQLLMAILGAVPAEGWRGLDVLETSQPLRGDAP
jgi:hypothetical protein